jgi:hypothetical protein
MKEVMKMEKSLKFKKYIVMIAALLCSPSLLVAAMGESDPYAWSPHAETAEYKQEIEEAMKEKKHKTVNGELGVEDDDESEEQPGAEGHEPGAQKVPSENMQQAEVKASRNDASFDTLITDGGAQMLVGWVNAMGDGVHTVPNAPYQENALPPDLQGLISEYQKEWRVMHTLPCIGSCEGTDGRQAMISRGIYKGQDSIFIPFKREEKPILSARHIKKEQWYLGIINCETHALQTIKCDCCGPNRWPVAAFPLRTGSASMGLIIIADDGQVQWHYQDLTCQFPRVARSATMLSEQSLAIGSVDGHVEIWALDGQHYFERTHEWQGEKNEKIVSIASIPSSDDRGPFLVFCSHVQEPNDVASKGLITLWNCATGESWLLHSRASESPAWNHVIAMPDGCAVVAMSVWGIEAWDVATGRSLSRIALTQGMPDNGVRIAPISNDEVAILTVMPSAETSAAATPCMRILNIRTGQLTDAPFDTAGARTCDAMIALPDGQVLVRRGTASTMVCEYKDHYVAALRENRDEVEDEVENRQSTGIAPRIKRYMQSKLSKKGSEATSSKVKREVRRLFACMKRPGS